jgi:hypothetical protein
VTEPWHRSEPQHSDVLDELARLEPLFHGRDRGTTMAEIERMVSDDFWEVGASGRRYARDLVMRVVGERLENPAEEHLQPSDFAVRELGPGLFLLTYAMEEPDRRTLRSTIWRKTPDGWQAEYHQGTVVGD